MKRVLLTVAVAVSSSLITVLAFRAIDKKQSDKMNYFANQTPAMPAGWMGHGAVTGPDFVMAAEKTVHAVVHIKTLYNYKNSYYDQFFGYDPFFNLFRSNPYNAPLSGMGSGVIVSENGYIVTNNHVVSDASKIEVTLNDKRTYEATLVGSDQGTDLALIKINEENLPFVTYGNSDLVKTGEWVLAVGNPFNLTSTVTAGIVSAKARDINIWGDKTSVESFIQTDAAVNPGNSGGALVNASGDLIGINAAIATNTGSYTGYSFAIPSNIVRKVIADLIEFGEVQRAYIGADFTDVDAELARTRNLKEIKGVYVSSVVEGGAAFKSGIRPGDIIIRFDGTSVNSQSELKEQIIRKRPGEKVNIGIIRNGSEEIYEVVLQNRKGGTVNITDGSTGQFSLMGAVFSEIGNKEKENLGVEYGVQVVKIGRGAFMSAGIRENFIITSIDNKPVKSTADVARYMENKKGNTVIEGLYPNGMRAYYAFYL